MIRRILRAWPAAAVVAAGCGGAPDLVPVAGTVTLDGQPLALKTVQFVPEPGTPGTGAGGNTGADGGYSLLAVRPGAVTDTPGVSPGAYKVVVTEPVFPIDAPAGAAGDEVAPAVGVADPRAKKKGERKGQPIPPAYTKPDTTPLRVQVPADGGRFDLTLKAEPPGRTPR